MRFLLALIFAAPLAGCSMGTPARLESSSGCAASRQSIAPVTTYGFNPVVRQGIGIPVDTARCLSGFLTRGIADAFATADCVLDTLVPIVAPPQSVIQTAPQSAPCAPMPTYAPAPAPKSTPVCQNGACAVGR